jgi:hypothetical protein
VTKTTAAADALASNSSRLSNGIRSCATNVSSAPKPVRYG